ncbi:hypothetical protein [Lentzea albida]|uniref:Uncharacterized protein n=1 Tax=Lentzea albida TaxID=65499 RepID=A0A1H9W983_9PSEU|nr:hypothetical protein [Lentzea albida]SES30482.1 hypothetical protein SAMN04488000_12173 [Lentzea albida]
MPPRVAPVEPAPPFDVTPHAGAYERAGVRIDVTGTDDGPRLRMTATGAMADLYPDPTIFDGELLPGPDDHFLARQRSGTSWLPVTFYRLPTKEPYVHLGGRATPKV